jgi:sugar phosphate isomerase/epimerase
MGLPQTIRLGCCGSMIAPLQDAIGVEILEPLAELGFDYIELSLRDLVELPREKLDALSQRLQRVGLPCEACNNFFPGRIPLTGPSADHSAAMAYAHRALETAARLRCTVVVFGSGDARRVPAGFPIESAWCQLRDLLRAMGPLAGKLGITIVIEHLNRRECNIVNSLTEGCRLAREVGHPSIRVLADFYHMHQEGEANRNLMQAAEELRHVHLAASDGRRFPRPGDALMETFFIHLQQTSYSGRCSIEAYSSDFLNDARRSLAMLRELSSRSPEACAISTTHS